MKLIMKNTIIAQTTKNYKLKCIRVIFTFDESSAPIAIAKEKRYCHP
jgi:hypothetical protein